MDLLRLPRAIFRRAVPDRLQSAVDRGIYVTRNPHPPAPTLDNIAKCGGYFGRKYRIDQLRYFETLATYNLDRSVLNREEASGENGLVRGISRRLFANSAWPGAASDDVIATMSLSHIAALDFLIREAPPKAHFLDIGCGLGHFFLQLNRFGFSEFTGVDDQTFNPGITQAADEFLKWYGVTATILDFRNVGFHGRYKAAGLYGKADVVSIFGFPGYSLFDLAYHLLKPGGYFIQESMETALGVFETDFRTLAIYSGYGRQDRKPFVTTIYQKIG